MENGLREPVEQPADSPPRLRRPALPKPGGHQALVRILTPFESLRYLLRSSWASRTGPIGNWVYDFGFQTYKPSSPPLCPRWWRAFNECWDACCRCVLADQEKETTCRWKCMAGGMSGPELRRCQCCSRSWLCPCDSCESRVCNRNGVVLSSIG